MVAELAEKPSSRPNEKVGVARSVPGPVWRDRGGTLQLVTYRGLAVLLWTSARWMAPAAGARGRTGRPKGTGVRWWDRRPASQVVRTSGPDGEILAEPPVLPGGRALTP